MVEVEPRAAKDQLVVKRTSNHRLLSLENSRPRLNLERREGICLASYFCRTLTLLAPNFGLNNWFGYFSHFSSQLMVKSYVY